MKIRQGFVSNSSSSSFILGCETTAEALGEILDALELEGELWTSPDVQKAREFLEQVGKGFNEPIIYPYTINYETLIYPEGRYIRVDTCNNHDWTEYLDIVIPRTDSTSYDFTSSCGCGGCQ